MGLHLIFVDPSGFKEKFDIALILADLSEADSFFEGVDSGVSDREDGSSILPDQGSGFGGAHLSIFIA